MLNRKQILVIDDKSDVRLSARFFLSNHGFDIMEADGPASGLEVIKNEHIDLVLMDMNFSLDTTSGEEGLFCLRKINELDETIPVIAMTAWSSVDLVVKSLRNGARDFIEKPWDNQRLLQVVQQSLKLGTLEKQNQKLQQQASDHNSAIELVARSPAMKNLMSQLDEVAKTDATILLTGENGTGKSTLAHYVHQQSLRKEGQLVSVNMGAIPDNLFESEMFGHTKGAFTGAHQARIGRFELAEGGSLFLDEVANIPLAAQAKLLRVLESREYERVGSSMTQLSDVRLISATNASFDQLISGAQFRQDLYFRLNTIELRVPSLRERVEDIPELAEIMLVKQCQRYNKPAMTLLPCALEALSRYDFPGNLRELSHILERIALLHKDPLIGGEHLKLNGSSTTPAPAADLSLMTIEQAERLLIDKALVQTQGLTHEAATLLGLSKSAIYRRLEKYNIVAKNYVDKGSVE